MKDNFSYKLKFITQLTGLLLLQSNSSYAVDYVFGTSNPPGTPFTLTPSSNDTFTIPSGQTLSGAGTLINVAEANAGSDVTITVEAGASIVTTTNTAITGTSRYFVSGAGNVSAPAGQTVMTGDMDIFLNDVSGTITGNIISLNDIVFAPYGTFTFAGTTTTAVVGGLTRIQEPTTPGLSAASDSITFTGDLDRLTLAGSPTGTYVFEGAIIGEATAGLFTTTNSYTLDFYSTVDGENAGDTELTFGGQTVYFRDAVGSNTRMNTLGTAAAGTNVTFYSTLNANSITYNSGHNITMNLHDNVTLNGGGTATLDANATLAIHSSLTFTSGGYTNAGTHEVVITDPTNIPRFTSTGGVTLDNATFKVTFNGTLIPTGTYVLLTGSSLSTTGMTTVEPVSSFLRSISIISNTASGEISLFCDSRSPSYYATTAANTVVGDHLAQFARDNPLSSDIVNVYSDLGRVPSFLSTTQDAMEQQLNKFHPFATHSQATINNHGQTATIVQSRLAARNNGYLAGDRFNLAAKNLWLKPLATYSKHQHSRYNLGFKAKTFGVVGGYDLELCANTTLGAGVGYLYARSKPLDTFNTDTNIDSIHAFLYGEVSNNEQTASIDWVVNYAYNQHRANRQVTTGSFIGNTKASYNSNQLSAKITENHKILSMSNLSTIARFNMWSSLQYIYQPSYAYTETGNSLIALHVNTKSRHFVDLELGIKSILQHTLMQKKHYPELKAGLNIMLINNSIETQANFVGTNAIFNDNNKSKRLSLLFGAGYTYQYHDRLSIFASYDLKVNDVFIQHGGAVEIKYDLY